MLKLLFMFIKSLNSDVNNLFLNLFLKKNTFYCLKIVILELILM